MTVVDEPEPHAGSEERAPEVALGPETADYLDGKAAESFKRQADLEESIWRSLPLLTGALIAAAALIASEASMLPPLSWALLPLISYTLVGVALLAFAAAFRWLRLIVLPREFEYPPDDPSVAAYARDLTAFHEAQGLTGADLDARVLSELRAYITTSLGNAAKSTFSHNQLRLSARNQVIFFLLWGFVISFVAGLVIYGHKLISDEQESAAADHATQTDPTLPSAGAASSEAGTASSAPDAGDPGRRVANQVEQSSSSQEQVDERQEGDAPAFGNIPQPTGPPVTSADADGDKAHGSALGPGQLPPNLTNSATEEAQIGRGSGANGNGAP